jgi:membrane protease YdiL (CAAX protease family)
MDFIRKNQLWIYFLIALSFSALIAYFSHTTQNEDISILIPLSPSILAIAFTAIVAGRGGLRELLRDQTKFNFSPVWWLTAIVLFPLLGTLAVTIGQFAGGPELALIRNDLGQLIPLILISLGEEYGWRAYALPKLQQKFNALTASMILGLVWGLWHFPGFLIQVGVPRDISFVTFMTWVIAATVLITWVYNHTRSVVAAIVMHTAANAAFSYLPLLPEWTGQPVTFNIFIALVVIAAVYVVFEYGQHTLIKKESA